MENIKKIIVGLDGSSMDNTLLDYTRFVCNQFPVTKVYFVHIIKSLNQDDRIVKEFPDLIKNAIAEKKEQIKDEVKLVKLRDSIELEYVIEIGRTTHFMMDFAKASDTDLIIIGRKVTMSSTSTTGPRLARRADCNLLIVPEGTKPGTSNLLVPVDYSDHSRLAFHYALDMARANEGTTITTQNVYSVPIGYYSLGKSKKQFSSIMKKHAMEDFDRFIKPFDTSGIKIEKLFNEDKDQDITSDIVRECKELNPDWLILGAKGRSATTALFIGSFAEAVISSITHIPIFIARLKGKNAGFLDLLKEI